MIQDTPDYGISRLQKEIKKILGEHVHKWILKRMERAVHPDISDPVIVGAEKHKGKGL